MSHRPGQGTIALEIAGKTGPGSPHESVSPHRLALRAGLPNPVSGLASAAKGPTEGGPTSHNRLSMAAGSAECMKPRCRPGRWTSASSRSWRTPSARHRPRQPAHIRIWPRAGCHTILFSETESYGAHATLFREQHLVNGGGCGRRRAAPTWPGSCGFSRADCDDRQRPHNCRLLRPFPRPSSPAGQPIMVREPHCVKKSESCANLFVSPSRPAPLCVGTRRHGHHGGRQRFRAFGRASHRW